MPNGVTNTAHRNLLLLLLGTILCSNFIDRLALGVLLESIKADLQLSDTELGFLSGIAFALFYSVMGVPIARWADRGDRVAIITLTTALWSIAVAMCGMARNFTELLLIRIGVAVGEAGCIPPAHSLIADYFPRAERPRAAARYMLGLPFAMMIGYFAAGWLNEFYGWRLTFVSIGLPGLLLAVLASRVLKEPRRLNTGGQRESAVANTASADAVSQATLKQVLSALWGSKTYRHLLLCYSVGAFFGYGLLQWQPAFFIRSFGLPSGELGLWLAVVSGIPGLIGIYLGGECGTRFAPNNERLQLRGMAVMFSFFALFNAAAYVAPNHYMAFGILALANLGGNMVQGPILATVQTLVPSSMRAMAIAMMFLFSNLIGMGLGPLAVGAVSDFIHAWAGVESLRYSLVIFCPGYVWAAWHAWHAGQSIGRDMASVHADIEGSSPRMLDEQIRVRAGDNEAFVVRDLS